MNRKRSQNQVIFSSLLRKFRRGKTLPNVNYLILYGFLYKFMSDKVKNLLLRTADEKDIRYFYSDPEHWYEIRNLCLDELGYFIGDYSAFIDQFIKDNLIEDISNPEFFTLLKNNIEFSADNPCEKYFNQIIELMENQYRSYSLNRDEDLNSFVGNFMYAISKFDIEEKEFTFAMAYDSLPSLRSMRISPTPEYISNVISSIVESQKSEASKVYDPFMRDSSILFSLMDTMPVNEVYGKENSKLNYFYTLIKAFIHEADFTGLFLYNENAVESMSVGDNSFDVILAKIPNRSSGILKSKEQSLEVPNENTGDFKKKFLSNLDLDKISDDKEALEALKVLENRYKELELKDAISFTGEYEILKDSEFLFLINMINSLKDDGVMVVSLSQNFLFKSSLATLRKFLTYENNYIDAIISLPEGLDRLIRPEVIIVFRKDKTTGDIVFVDLSKEYDTDISRNAVRGIGRRNLVLDSKTINKVIEVINSRKIVKKFSEIVALNDLVKNDFNLTVSRYVDTYEGEFIRLEDIKTDKTDIEYEMNQLNDKIDKLLHDLDMYF